ncbi:MAG: glycerol-3-phosphate acyltransferase [Coriobacteriales bacterium]
MTERLICLAIGYLLGCILTADIVAKAKTGKPARKLGTGNPGMANIGALFGKKYAGIVLAGDIVKVIAAVVIARLLFPELGSLAALWAGCGTVIGHNFPFWTGFKGGKGVTVTCATMILFDPVWGVICCLIGLAVSAATKYLPIGAVMIPTTFLIPTAIFHSTEALLLVVFLTAMMFLRHGKPLARALRGKERKVDVAKNLKRKD